MLAGAEDVRANSMNFEFVTHLNAEHAVCEQLITGFSQLIQKGNITINLLLACVILFYDVIAYYINSSFINL